MKYRIVEKKSVIGNRYYVIQYYCTFSKLWCNLEVPKQVSDIVFRNGTLYQEACTKDILTDVKGFPCVDTAEKALAKWKNIEDNLSHSIVVKEL